MLTNKGGVNTLLYPQDISAARREGDGGLKYNSVLGAKNGPTSAKGFLAKRVGGGGGGTPLVEKIC